MSHGELYSDLGIPAIEQYRRRTEQKRTLEGVDRTSDMTDRRRDEKRVAPLDQPMPAQLADQSMDRVLGVQHTLRSSGRPRCVQHEPHGIRLDRWQLAIGVLCEQ